jgi:hypothetical protein
MAHYNEIVSLSIQWVKTIPLIMDFSLLRTQWVLLSHPLQMMATL